MPRLFLKLIGTFWLTTLLILSISIFVSFRLAADDMAERLIDPREIDASLREVVDRGGVAALREWVADPGNFLAGQTVYVVDAAHNELLDRDVPTYLEERLDRIWAMLDREANQQEGHNSDRSFRRSTSVLETADGSRWLAIPGPTAPPRFGVLSYGSLRWLVLGLAAVTSLVTFWFLSRSMSQPARRIAAAVSRFATGDMSARVGAAGNSNDEIGEIGRQFDSMATKLEEQTALRSELYRNVSHELRAPLARLQIASELLERNPERVHDQLARIRSEVEVLDALTAQVLSLTRASESKGNIERVGLIDVIDQVVGNCQLESGDKDIDFEVVVPAKKVVVHTDRTMLASALENVVRNAVQAITAQGKVTIAAQVHGGRCTVTVTDTGTGVPEAELERIFEPFYRLDTNRPGSGIGLAIAARVIEQAGGSVAASNADGGGLIVTLVLPAMEE